MMALDAVLSASLGMARVHRCFPAAPEYIPSWLRAIYLEILGELKYAIVNEPFGGLLTRWIPSPPQDTTQSLIPLPEDLPFKVRGGTPDAMKTPSKLAYLEVLPDGDAIWTSPPPSCRQWANFIREESVANFVKSRTMAESLREEADLLAKDDENKLQRTRTPRRATFPIEKEQLASAKKSQSPPVFRYNGDDCNVNVCIVKTLLAQTPKKSVLKNRPASSTPVGHSEAQSGDAVKFCSPVKDGGSVKKFVRLSLEQQASVDRLSVPKRIRLFRPDPTPFTLNQGKKNTLRGWMKENASPLEEESARRRLFAESPDMKAAFGVAKNPPRKVLGVLTSNIPEPCGQERLR